MILWIDAQLSPALAPWLSERFEVQAVSVKHLGFRDALDRDIFLAAKEARAAIMTKDSDFLRLLEQLDPPPSIIWITLGNTSNASLKNVLERSLPQALRLLASGESLVEISDPL